jgi:hypothetical protein
MSKVSLPKPAMSRKRFRLLLVGLLVVSVLVIAMFGAPLASPFTIGKVTFARNTFVPITPNGGFELNDNTWTTAGSGPGVASIVSGGASSGSRSLYINDPGQSIFVWYNDSTIRALPLLINSSVTIGFDLLFKGNAVPQGTGAVWITLFLSWRLLPNATFPLTMVLGNYSVYTDSTYDSVNASAGIIMLRGLRAMGSWTTYELQLGTPRVDSLIKGYLQANSSTFYNPGDPMYIVGLRIAADNADAYFDNVALYNVVPSTVAVSLSKSTLLPSNLLGLSTTLNGYAENATVSYGATSDTISFVSDLPLAYNATYQVVLQTGWSTSVYSVRVNDTTLPSWI